MLAYSTLSQIAVMASALAFVLGPDEAPDLALGHLFSHALFKSLLFLAVGWLSVLAGGTAFVALRGRARGRGALTGPSPSASRRSPACRRWSGSSPRRASSSPPRSR